MTTETVALASTRLLCVPAASIIQKPPLHAPRELLTVPVANPVAGKTKCIGLPVNHTRSRRESGIKACLANNVGCFPSVVSVASMGIGETGYRLPHKFLQQLLALVNFTSLAVLRQG